MFGWNMSVLVGSDNWIIASPYFTALNYTINGYVYISFNKTIRKGLKEFFGISTSNVIHVAPLQDANCETAL